ncbi:MAG: hypothetical protein AB7S26_04475 [Sandaracinaceae bacterium]
MATGPFKDLHGVYGFASGVDHRDCVFLGRRWRDEYGTTMADSDFSILVNVPDDQHEATTHLRVAYWRNLLTGIWRSPTKKVFVADASLPAIHLFADLMSDARTQQTFRLRFAPEGVYGFDDEHIYTFGTTKTADGDWVYPVARWDGSGFTEMPSPGFPISRMHGLAPDFLYAAGWRGGMARWDGRGWTNFPMPTGEVYTDVFVAGSDEMYATGLNGSFLEGSASGWTQVTQSVGQELPFACVAKCFDEVWVGGAAMGLFRRVGRTDQLELVRDDIGATSFDVHGDSLLITADTFIASTQDGQSYRDAAVDLLVTLTDMVDIRE